MGAPNPAGVTVSSAATQVAVSSRTRTASLPSLSFGGVASGLTFPGSLFVGMVVAALFLAYWYRRIL